MHKPILAALVIGSLASSGSALAQSTSRIDKRQEQQDKRIEKGLSSGQLNQKEAARLEKGQTHVQKMENKALSDGKVTKSEKRRIEHTQDQQNRRFAVRGTISRKPKVSNAPPEAGTQLHNVGATGGRPLCSRGQSAEEIL